VGTLKKKKKKKNLTTNPRSIFLPTPLPTTQIQRDFEDLPPGAAAPLRDALAAALTGGAGGAPPPPPVRTQVCCALAALATHIPAPDWPGGAGPVPWLSAALLESGHHQHTVAALELLAVLAEEASGYHPSLTPARRRAWAAEAGSAAPAALSVLARCVASPSPDPGVRISALAAYAAWVRLASASDAAGPLPGMDGAALAAHPLTAAALAGLADPACFDAAVDAVAELVYVSAMGGKPAPGMEALAGAIVPAVLSLRPRFAAAAARARGEAPSTPAAASPSFEDDDDTARGMARLFAEVGEAYVGLIAGAATPDAAAPAAALLDVAAHPDDGVAATSFNFWHRLARALLAGAGRGPPGRPGTPGTPAAAPHPPPPPSPAIAAFTPAYEALVCAIAGRVAWPPGHEAWRRDERADFKRARSAVGGTLLDAAALLGGRRTLELLTAPLAAAAAAVAGGGALDWRAAEAALYCVRAVHRCAPPPGDPLLSGLLASLPTLPPAPLLQYTACLTVGAYADWVASSAGAGGEGAAAAAGALAPLLSLVTRALACPDTAPAAALALRHLCDAAGGLLGPHLPDLAALAGAAAGAGAAARGGGGSARPSTDGGGGGGNPGGTLPTSTPGSSASLASLEEADVVAIGEAAALAAAAQPDPAARRAALESLLMQCEAGLAGVLREAPPGPRASSTSGGGGGGEGGGGSTAPASLICAMADRLAAVLSHCGPDPEAATASLARALPLVEAALAATLGDQRAAERLIRVPRYALRAAGPAAGGGPALAAVAAALPRWFGLTRCSAALYAASDLCKAHGRGAAGGTADALAGLLDALLRPVLASLTSTAAFDAAPDVADDAFLLGGRALAYCPALLLVAGDPASGGLLAPLLAAAVPGVLAQHREACASVLAFLQRAFDPEVLERADADGRALVAAASAAGGGGGGGGAAAAAAARLPPARDALASAVRPVAPALARALLAGVAGGLPSPRVRDVADVLLAMVRAAREAGVAWLADALALLPDAAAAQPDRARVLAAAGAAAAAGPGGSPGADAAVAQFDEAVDELSELARRSARARNAALGALVPETVGGRAVVAATG
jgi:transportin-3